MEIPEVPAADRPPEPRDQRRVGCGLIVVGLVLGPVLTVLLLFSFLGYGFCSDQSGDDARSCESDVRVQIVLLIVLIVVCLVAVIAGASMRSKRTDSGAPSDTSVPPPDQRPW